MNINVQFLFSMLMTFLVCHSNDVPDEDTRRKLEIVGQLNTMLSQPGWENMDILIRKENEIRKRRRNINEEFAPVGNYSFLSPSELLEVNLPSDQAVTLSNLAEKFMYILFVLQCKYAEVTSMYRILIKTLINTCRQKMNEDTNNLDMCFYALLIKLNSISVTIRYMRDALEFYTKIHPVNTHYYDLLDPLTELEKFTRDILVETNSKLDEYPSNKDKYKMGKMELQNIQFNILRLTKGSLYYIDRYCSVPNQNFTKKNFLYNEFVKNKNENLLLPSENVVLDYVLHKIDSYSGHIIKKCFYRLGFIYDATQSPEVVAFNKNILF